MGQKYGHKHTAEYYCIVNNPLRINSQVGGEWKRGVPSRVVNSRRTDKKYAENTATTLTKDGRGNARTGFGLAGRQ